MLLVYGASLQKWPVETRHEVRIETHPSAEQWWMVSKERPLGEMFYGCKSATFNDNNWIFSGYFAKEAKWEVRSNCDSIKADGLGFFYDWKQDGTAKTNREEGYE